MEKAELTPTLEKLQKYIAVRFFMRTPIILLTAIMSVIGFIIGASFIMYNPILINLVMIIALVCVFSGFIGALFVTKVILLHIKTIDKENGEGV